MALFSNAAKIHNKLSCLFRILKPSISRRFVIRSSRKTRVGYFEGDRSGQISRHTSLINFFYKKDV